MEYTVTQCDAVPVEPTLLEELHLLRRRMAWKQDELAGKLDVSPATVRAWERKARKPGKAQQKLIRDFIEKHAARSKKYAA
jgi:DNA-binding transcriptional regulator YiaG